MLKFTRLDRRSGEIIETNPTLCSFGISEAIATAISSFLTADVGVGATTAGIIGDVGAGAVVKGAEGGLIGAVTDPKQPLKGFASGAEAGAITGGVGAGISPVIGEAGLGATATDVISQGIGGAAGAAAIGKNPLEGAALAGGGALLSDAIAGNLSPTGSTSSGGPTGSAASQAAPSSVGAGGGSPAEGVSATPSIGTPVATSPAAAAAPGSALAAAPSGFPAITSADLQPITPPNVTAPTGGGIGGFLKENSWALPAGALALEAIKGTSPLPGEKQLNASAKQLGTQGAQLQNYFATGTLPPGVQSGITTAAEAAKASIRSMYASRGMSGSSAEQQDLAGVESRAVTQGSQIALSLLQQGVSETGMADQLYLELMNSALTQDQALGQSIATFASALVPSQAA